MLRKTTLFVPGFDHAKISTQSVVEKRLFKSGRTRHHLGRDKLFETVWDWKNVQKNVSPKNFIGLVAATTGLVSLSQ